MMYFYEIILLFRFWNTFNTSQQIKLKAREKIQGKKLFEPYLYVFTELYKGLPTRSDTCGQIQKF